LFKIHERINSNILLKITLLVNIDLSPENLSAAHWPLARPPYLLETSLPGVFAVGDVRGGSIKRVASADFISWAITDGQRLAANLGYVPLPARVVKGDQDTLRLLTFKGTPLYTGP